MKQKKLVKFSVFCLTVFLLIFHGASAVLAGQFTLVTKWGHRTIVPDRRTDPTGLMGPAGVAIDPSGNVYVADSSNQRVEKYDSNGNFVSMLTECPDLNIADLTHCSDPVEIKGPTDVAVDPTGTYVYVVTGFWDRISKFDNAGHFILSWGWDPIQNNVVTDFMIEPTGIAVDAHGDVYVTDIGGSAIWKFDASGNLITMWTHPYLSGDGFRPTGIAVGPQGIYVTDYLNSTVYLFDYHGKINKSWGGIDSATVGNFTYPAAIDIDASGNMFVADMLNNRIQGLSGKKNGTWTAYTGGPAEGGIGITKPFGIATDTKGNVYVADTFNHRILKYKYTP